MIKKKSVSLGELIIHMSNGVEEGKFTLQEACDAIDVVVLLLEEEKQAKKRAKNAQKVFEETNAFLRKSLFGRAYVTSNRT